MFFSVLFYWSGGGEKGFTEIRFVLQIGTFCFETPEHFVLRIILSYSFAFDHQFFIYPMIQHIIV